ncbi:unnamed protein product, partial [Candidula unifasciata]
AIIGTHLYVRQLVYETLILCHKNKIAESLPSFLTKIEQIVEGDVEDCLRKENDNIEEHMELVKKILKNNLQNKKLIRLSQSQLVQKESTHVSEMLYLRVETILNRVNNELCLRSANRSFQASKTSLKTSMEELKQQNSKVEEENSGFVFVENFQ